MVSSLLACRSASNATTWLVSIPGLIILSATRAGRVFLFGHVDNAHAAFADH